MADYRSEYAQRDMGRGQPIFADSGWRCSTILPLPLFPTAPRSVTSDHSVLAPVNRPCANEVIPLRRSRACDLPYPVQSRLSPRLFTFFRSVVCLFAVWGPSWARAEGLSSADSRFIVHTWETDDGLPHNTVLSVLQGADGFLWIATNGGLVRFDGKTFVASQSPLLADESAAAIRSIVQESPGVLLAASAKGGLVRIARGRHETHPATQYLRKGERVQRLFMERDGVLWIALADRQLIRWTAGGAQRLPPPQTPWPPWPITFAVDVDGRVHISRGAGVENYADGALVRVASLPARPCSLAASRTGGFWVWTEARLYRWPKGWARAIRRLRSRLSRRVTGRFGWAMRGAA